jgi:hypothetical protein
MDKKVNSEQHIMQVHKMQVAAKKKKLQCFRQFDFQGTLKMFKESSIDKSKFLALTLQLQPTF